MLGSGTEKVPMKLVRNGFSRTDAQVDTWGVSLARLG
jgi:hypothetical protein